MKKIYFILSIAIALVFSMISCKKENNRITNSTYSIDSIEVFLDSIKQLSLIPGDLSVFDSIKQMNDTTAYYLLANYDYNVNYGTIGGTAQIPRFLVKNNHLVGIDYYLPSGTYGQYGNEYRRANYYYNSSNKIDSINFGAFSFRGMQYDENIFFSAIRNPDSMQNGLSDASLQDRGSLLHNYNNKNLISIDLRYDQNINRFSNINYGTIDNQNNLIGLDINQLIINSLFSYGIISGYSGTNGAFAFPLMLVNTNLKFGVSADKLITSIDTTNINYNFDTMNNNRINTICFNLYISNQKLKYVFHYQD